MNGKNKKLRVSLPLEICRVINDYAKPLTRPDWRLGSPLAKLIHQEINRLGYCHFNWTHMTLSSFLISHDLMKTSIFNLDNEDDYRLWKSIILYVEKQFLDNGYYL